MSKKTVWLLIRGLTTAAYNWNEFPEKLAASYPEAKILTPDLPGNGERYNETSPGTIKGMVEAYRQQRDITGHSMNVIALSMGGMIGMQWLYDYPNEIERLIVINSSAAHISAFYSRMKFKSLLALIRAANKGGIERERALLEYTTNLHQQDEALAQRWADYSRKCPITLSNGIRQMWAASRFSLPGRFPPEMADKVTIIQSLQDNLVNSQCSQHLAEYLKCQMITHPKAGHDLTVDASEWLIEEVLQANPHKKCTIA